MNDFIQSPQGVTFETQAEDEHIVLLLRKHIVTNVGWVLLTIFLALIPPLFLLEIFNFGLTDFFPLSPEQIVVLTLAWYLFVIGFAFEHFMIWYFNIYVLTDHRAVDVDFYHLLYKRVSAADLSDVQDVTFTMGGLAQAAFNYGNVHIQTAGTAPEFEFTSVPKPAFVQKTILELSRPKRHP